MKNFFIFSLMLLFILIVLHAEKAKQQKDFQYVRYSFKEGVLYDAMTEATKRIIRSTRDIPDSDVPEIEPDVLKAWLDEGEKVMIVDVRKYQSYQREHIKGAVSIPIGEMEKRYNEIPWEKEIKVVLYCGSSSCPLSFASTKRLLALGFTNVTDLKGGIDAWQQKGYPTIKTETPSNN